MNGNNTVQPPSQRLIRWTAIAIGAAVCLIALLSRLTDFTESALLQPGATAPSFVLRDQEGRSHNLRDYAGRPVALAFLPNLGESTLAELRSINRSIRQFDTLGVKVFGIVPAVAGDVRRVHDGETLNFPLLIDADCKVAGAYGIRSIPNAGTRASYVIGVDGRVMLPIASVQMDRHGEQLVELSECCLDAKPLRGSRLIGKPVADFTLADVATGRPVSLYGDRKQKATVLYVMSAECPCSARYDGRFVDYARRYERSGVRFLAMNSSDGESAERVANHARVAGYSFPVVKDSRNLVADRIEAKVTPEVFVFDSAGVLRYHGRIDDNRNPEYVQSHDLQNALDFLLAGKNPRQADTPMFGCAIARVPATGRTAVTNERTL